MNELTLNTSGLYVVTHLSTNKQYLVAFKGKAPLLKVVNFVGMETFLAGYLEDTCESSKESIKDILEEEPGKFSYYKIETTTINTKIKEKKIQAARSQLSDYKKVSENLDKYLDLIKTDEENAIVQICTAEEVSYEIGKEIAKLTKLACR